MESTLNPTPVRQFTNASKSNSNVVMGIISVSVIVVGILSGYLLTRSGNESGVNSNSTEIKVNKDEAGVVDESKYPDTAEGILEEGGIQGEGTYHLVRGVGPSQYAYLTSSVIDMAPFVGKKVKIWGQTLSGKKAGWLLDVGKIKVIE